MLQIRTVVTSGGQVGVFWDTGNALFDLVVGYSGVNFVKIH